MRLHYRDYGAGPPLVILHGLFGSLNNWHSHATFLGERYHVLVVDLRNHGGSPHSPIMTYAAMAEDILEFIKEHNTGPVNLLGHSMGGRAAMQCALSFPDEVRRLVVVDIRPQGDPPRHSHIIEGMQRVDFSTVRSREDVDAALLPWIPDQAERQLLEMNLQRTGEGTFRWKINLEAIAAQYAEIIGPVTAKGQFDGPTLFLNGGKSAYVGVDDRPAIAAMFPGVRFVEIPQAGHWVHADAPAEFRRIVMEFLA
jgi:esterase